MPCPQHGSTTRRRLRPGWFQCTAEEWVQVPTNVPHPRFGPAYRTIVNRCGARYAEREPGVEKLSVCTSSGCSIWIFEACARCIRPRCLSHLEAIGGSWFCRECATKERLAAARAAEAQGRAQEVERQRQRQATEAAHQAAIDANLVAWPNQRTLRRTIDRTAKAARRWSGPKGATAVLVVLGIVGGFWSLGFMQTQSGPVRFVIGTLPLVAVWALWWSAVLVHNSRIENRKAEAERLRRFVGCGRTDCSRSGCRAQS